MTSLFLSQQPLAVTPAGAALLSEDANPRKLFVALTSGDAGVKSAGPVLASFDALVMVDGEPFVAPVAPFLMPAGSEPNFAFYRIAH